jgi:hypothetical protein
LQDRRSLASGDRRFKDGSGRVEIKKVFKHNTMGIEVRSAWREPEEDTVLDGGSLTGEQRRFFEELLAYLHNELEDRKDPEAVEQRVRMFASLAGEEGKDWVLKDQRFAEQGLVYLARKGKKYLKHIGELSPGDVPDIMSELEATAAVSGEYVESDGVVCVFEYGGRKLTTPDVGDPSAPLRTRWRGLKEDWPA